MTPREFEAHRRLWDAEQRQHLYEIADLKALLHNAWFKRRDNPDAPFTAEEFLPESVRPPRRQKSPRELMAAWGVFVESQNKTG